MESVSRLVRLLSFPVVATRAECCDPGDSVFSQVVLLLFLYSVDHAPSDRSLFELFAVGRL